MRKKARPLDIKAIPSIFIWANEIQHQESNCSIVQAPLLFPPFSYTTFDRLPCLVSERNFHFISSRLFTTASESSTSTDDRRRRYDVRVTRSRRHEKSRNWQIACDLESQFERFINKLKNQTLDIIVQFIILIQQSDGSEC